MPEKIECRYCGRIYSEGQTVCTNCGASLADGFRRLTCDKCGRPVPDGTDPVGKCVTCGKEVYLCDKHFKRLKDDEVFCNEHESECFIATAVFGTPLDPHLDILREFRDKWLLTTPIGRVAVFTYYEISPPIARKTRKSPILKKIFRTILVEPGLGLARIVLGKDSDEGI